MSEARREQHPLLGDDLSGDDQYSPRYQRRFRSKVFRSRVRNNLKGAAAVFRRWPDHWYRTVICWWFGLGMIAIITLVIYNGMVAFALLPPEQITAPRYLIPNNVIKPDSDQSSSLPMVNMHVFINTVNDLDLTKYLPYIEIISNKYRDFKYHLIFVVIDTDDDHALSAEENNEIALNSLLDKSHIHGNINNVIIEQVNLSKYMNSSPLRKYWRSLPQQFIEFLVRAISIWEKGGIALNPVILTPHSPNSIYFEKLRGILKEYKENSNKQYIRNITTFETKTNITSSSKKPAKKVNNIRDIIDAIEDSDIDTNNQHSLAEAEDKEIVTLALVERSTENRTNSNGTKGKFLNEAFEQNATLTDSLTLDDQNSSIKSTLNQNAGLENNKIRQNRNNKTANLNLWPLFIKYLFSKKVTTNVSEIESEEEPTSRKKYITLTRKRKNVLPKENHRTNKNATSLKNDIVKNKTAKYKPMFISTSAPNMNIEGTNLSYEFKYYDGQLVIDLKGNIIATKTPCHAFIGTVFNNVIHRSQNESVTDFIITELSLFCKGLLSSCNGIEVLLI